MNENAIGTDAAARNGSDALLDAVFTDANAGLLAAIREGLDLEGGLAQIIGAPPRLEMPAQDLPPQNDESPQDSRQS